MPFVTELYAFGQTDTVRNYVGSDLVIPRRSERRPQWHSFTSVGEKDSFFGDFNVQGEDIVQFTHIRRSLSSAARRPKQ